MLDVAAFLLVLTALLTYVNHRFLRIPTTIGVMAIALFLSLAIVGLHAVGLDHGLKAYEKALLQSINFSDVLMQGMLSFLLFAAALHIDLTTLTEFRWQIAVLAIFGTCVSTAIVGMAMWWLLPWIGLSLPLIYCLLFGALISPTDPISVMGILKSIKAPKRLELVIAGESLFNDGVAVVLFSLLLGIAASGVTPTPNEVGMALLHEAGGGIAFGLALGFVTFRLLKSIDQYHVEVLLTLAAVMGGYALAQHLHVSGPLAMVVVGLMVGNGGRARAMSDTTWRYVDMFWELLDDILNAVLFVLIGMEVILIVFSPPLLLAVACAIAITLVARLLTVGAPVRIMSAFFRLPPGSWQVLTWGGLRGGISVALAFSLAPGPSRDTLLALTYGVVVFSVLVQGLTLGIVARNATELRAER